MGAIWMRLRNEASSRLCSFVALALILGVAGGVVVTLGLAAGRWTWSAVASSIFSISPPLVPVLAVLLVVPAALMVANAIAGIPGWRAARISPATVLREE